MINDLQSITDLTTGCSFKLVPESFRQTPFSEHFASTRYPRFRSLPQICNLSKEL